MPWIDDVMAATEEAESPRSYIYWSALAAVSAVVKKNVYLDKFIYKLYPNIFVLLIGPSGTRKGFPISLAGSLVKAVGNTRIISGQNTIQSVITELANMGTTIDDKPMKTDSAGLLLSDEFHVLLSEDPTAISTLTSLYDTHAHEDDWKKSTKGSGVDVLKDPCLTLLGASNMVNLQQALPEYAWKGGFIARTVMVSEDKRSRKNALTRAPKTKLDKVQLSKYLVELSQLKGKFEYTPDGMAAYEDWYENAEPEAKEDSTGTENRIHDTILKVAMVLSLARGTDLKLTGELIHEAIDNCTRFSAQTESASQGSGKAPNSAATSMLLQYLLKRPEYKATRKEILQKNYGDFDAIQLSAIVGTLTEGGFVVIEKVGQDVYYSLTSKIIETYERAKKKKN